MTRLSNQTDMPTPNGFSIEPRNGQHRSEAAYHEVGNGFGSTRASRCSRTVRMRRCSLALLTCFAFVCFVALIVCLCLLSDRARLDSLQTGERNATAYNNVSQVYPTAQTYKEAPSASENVSYRIPRTVLPLYYKVTVFPDIYADSPVNFTFQGWQLFTFSAIGNVDRVFLHASMLVIDVSSVELWKGEPADDQEPLEFDPKLNSTLRNSDAQPRINLLAMFYHEEFLYYELVFNETLQSKQNYTLRLEWRGVLMNWTHGLYISSYEENNQTHYLAITQFEPTFAREAFPCVDEPSAKAIFSIRLVRHPSFHSISNSALSRTATVKLGNQELAIDIFKPTPQMSTYILAFAVCDYEYRSVTEDGILYRFWGRRSSLSELSYLMQVTPQIVRYLQQQFKIPYVLEKLDSIGVPDFSAQAMENWGLVTYMETFYYYKEKSDSLSQRQQVALLVAHEMAHMWFGNLVTMKWWDDVWLKEGLATYYSYLAANFVEPTFELNTASVVDMTQTLLLDSIATGRTVLSTVDSPVEIEAIFDAITYDKAAALCRMMSTILGEQTFLKGIQIYLNWFKFQSTDSKDLLRALSVQSSMDGSNYDMEKVMANWLESSNFPLVTVNRTFWSPKSQTIRISQRHFVNEANSTERSWQVPVSIMFWGTSQLTTVWLLDNQTESTFVLNVSSNEKQWFVANPGFRAFYRVNYDANNWAYIVQSLQWNHTMFDKATRVQLLDDAFSLASVSLLQFSTFFNLTLYLRNERDYHPWQVVINSFGHMKQLLSRTAHTSALYDYMRYLLEPLYTYVGWEANGTELPTKTLMRRLILQESCDVAVPSCVNKSRSLFDSWQAGSTAGIIPELTKTIRCTAIKYGSADDWSYLLSRYNEETRALDRVGFASALACTRNTSNIELLLATLFGEADLNSQEFIDPFSALCSNPNAHELVKRYFFENLLKLWSNNPSLVLMHYVFGESASQRDLDELHARKEQFEDLGPAEDTYNAAIRSIEKNLKWVEKHQQTIASWLSQFRLIVPSN